MAITSRVPVVDGKFDYLAWLGAVVDGYRCNRILANKDGERYILVGAFEWDAACNQIHHISPLPIPVWFHRGQPTEPLFNFMGWGCKRGYEGFPDAPPFHGVDGFKFILAEQSK